ncbi:hypothetical protein DY000_02033586 [Brassica cretica]|uniref:Uncharacterized protein n=1 Tax=Brassica cretica TaxID=69181 RepID=A0ABQ7DMI1_BRACR|nr:hypothetical protein DY000_02033586 [Brassica cretica]
MLSARNSKHPEPKPKSQNPKPSRDPTNPNHPIASLVPAHVPDQLQPKAFLILDELSLSYHPGQLAFPDSKRSVRTRRSSRSRSDSKQLASPISCSRPQPQSGSQLASSPARAFLDVVCACVHHCIQICIEIMSEKCWGKFTS